MKAALPALIALLIAATTIFILMNLPASIWSGWQPATCLQRGCFCEASNEDSPIRQMANTISSLGYVFSGMLAMKKQANVRRFSFGYAILFGVSSITIGIGSAFYHASLTFIGQFTDVLGMFLLATFMLVYAFERLWNLRLLTTFGLFLAINLFFCWMQFAFPDTRRYAFAIVLIVALLFEAHYRSKAQPQITTHKIHVGVGLLAAAYIIWILDNTRTLCIETSLLQGHALWHLLGAVAVWFLYEYYASEK